MACSSQHITYLCYPPDVLVPVFLGEAQILVEAEPNIVAVKSVCCESEMQKVLLERGCDGGFSGCGEAGKPDGEALLLAEAVALSAGERWVPCNVAELQC